MPKPRSRLINGQYALEPKPISGGMADVYPATDMLGQMRKVAVKIFKQGRVEKEVIQESFRRETQALQDLKHPGIVAILDSGRDEATGDYFLVMEWMEKDLKALLKESPPDGWDSFWQGVALPLLEALAFSHKRQSIHRDIKPSNILFNADGQLKLADFGISKLKRYLEPGVTLRDFKSLPFTPPEADDGAYTYTRDVFSFGVLVLKCLTDVELADWDTIPEAMAALRAPEKIVDEIQLAVSLDPAERQGNAEVLLARLKAIQGRPTTSLTKKNCYLTLTIKASSNLQNETKAASDNEIKRIILDDLSEACGIKIYGKGNSDSPEEKSTKGLYSVFGAYYSYHMKVDEQRERLVILNANKFYDSATLERNRERAWNPPYEFNFERPWVFWEAQEAIAELELAVEEWEADRRQIKAEEEKQRLFRVWGDIIRAKTDWEEKRETPLRYKSFEVDGNRAIFELSSLPDEDIAGQPRRIMNSKGFSVLRGDVEEVKEDKLVLYIRDGYPERLPHSGELRFDISAAEVALNRQKAALDAVRFDRSVRADLRELLVNPQKVSPPDLEELEENIQFVQPLNPSQKEVVLAALATKDFLIVQGPPGTGKTTFITEAILQVIQQNPKARILLSSQTHVALDNALERIKARNSKLKLVRIGDRERVSENVDSLRLEEQMNQWREEVVDRGREFIADWSAQRGISPQQVKTAVLFQELKKIAIAMDALRQEIAIRQQEIDEIEGNAYDPENPDSPARQNLSPERLKEFQNIEEEIDDLRDKLKLARQEQKEKAKLLQELTEIKIDELMKLSAEECDLQAKAVADPNSPDAKLLQRLVAIQTEWLEQFGRSDRFNDPLIRRSQVVAGTCIGIAKHIKDVEFDLCIVDEASKATATEVLVPMAQAKRWLLVGDPKQLPPFQDEASRDSKFLENYDLTREDVKETLFDRLLQALPEANRKILTIQHRMVAPIGDLVSHCFYEGKIESARTDIDSDLEAVLPKPVTWLTTAKLPNHSEQSANSSFNNTCEVGIAVDFLQRLDQMAAAAGKKYSVAVLTGYRAQLKLLARRVGSELNNPRAIAIECNTVDAFQGREADIALYSVTRSNKKGEVGFLRQAERLNVALSRGKVGLVIIGDSYFCSVSRNNPLQQVLNYIERHRDSCCLEEATPPNIKSVNRPKKRLSRP